MGRSVTGHGRKLRPSSCLASEWNSHHLEGASAASVAEVVVGNEVEVVDSQLRRTALSGDMESRICA